MVQYIALETDCRLFYFEALSIDLVLSNHVPSSFELIFCDLLVLGLEFCRTEKLCSYLCFNVYASDDIDTLLLINTIQVRLVVHLLPL